jgi:hypothetical protein
MHRGCPRMQKLNQNKRFPSFVPFMNDLVTKMRGNCVVITIP